MKLLRHGTGLKRRRREAQALIDQFRRFALARAQLVRALTAAGPGVTDETSIAARWTAGEIAAMWRDACAAHGLPESAGLDLMQAGSTRRNASLAAAYETLGTPAALRVLERPDNTSLWRFCWLQIVAAMAGRDAVRS